MLVALIGLVIVLSVPIFLLVKFIKLVLKSQKQIKQKEQYKEIPSEESLPNGYYSIIEDAGWSQEISKEEYLKTKDIAQVLLDHKKSFIIDKDGLEELLVELQECIPGFTHSYKFGTSGQMPGFRKDDRYFYQYKGEICGEPVDVEVKSPDFIIDVLNPILSKKCKKQLLFAFPGSDSIELLLINDDCVEKVKSNPYYWDYDAMEKYYGYADKY